MFYGFKIFYQKYLKTAPRVQNRFKATLELEQKPFSKMSLMFELPDAGESDCGLRVWDASLLVSVFLWFLRLLSLSSAIPEATDLDERLR